MDPLLIVDATLRAYRYHIGQPRATPWSTCRKRRGRSSRDLDEIWATGELEL